VFFLDEPRQRRLVAIVNFPEQSRIALAPGKDRLFDITHIEEAALPRGILHHLIDQVLEHRPLARARVLEFIEQPVVDLRIEPEVDQQPAILVALA
jgi:hypothetical protein